MEIDEIPVGRAEDLRGQKFGKLMVLYRVAKPKHVKSRIVYWKCKCDCGNFKITSSQNLKAGHTISCGCAYVGGGHFIDETGNKYGRLTVIEKIKREKGDKTHTKWRCKCDCGNEIIADIATLRDGRVQSCGCLNKERNQELFTVDMPIGSKFGLLTVISKAPSEDKCARWVCQCECGNTIIVKGVNLRSGNTKSCGCLKKSFGETYIKQLLNQHKINFSQEKTFKECINNTNHKLRFDFYVQNSYLIEFDGKQHFQITGGWGTEDYFKRLKEHDNIKNEYCKTHNIPLIRIPYWHYNDITIEDLKPETSQFLVT